MDKLLGKPKARARADAAGEQHDSDGAGRQGRGVGHDARRLAQPRLAEKRLSV